MKASGTTGMQDTLSISVSGYEGAGLPTFNRHTGDRRQTVDTDTGVQTV